MDQVGPKPVVKLMKKMGIQSYLPEVPSIALGTPDISLYEMVGAYSTFVNKGIYIEPIFITRILAPLNSKGRKYLINNKYLADRLIVTGGYNSAEIVKNLFKAVPVVKGVGTAFILKNDYFLLYSI